MRAAAAGFSVVFGLAGPAAAQPAPEVKRVVERVVITGGAERRIFDTPFAIGSVDADQLRAAGPMINLSEALVRVPGLVVNDRGNYAQDLQISSRGFGARSSFGVRGLRLYADGIPASGPDGQGQVTHFDLAGATRVEVLRGPFSALYGASSGGVIALVSAAPTATRATLDVDAGSHRLAHWRVGIAAPLGEGFSLAASASRFQTDGAREHSAASRELGNLRLGWAGAQDRVIVVLNHIVQPAQDPLGLSRAQWQADPGQTTPQALQFDTRKQAAQTQAGLSWQHRFNDAGTLRSAQLAAWRGQRSVTQWQSIPVATQANPRQPGGVIDFDRDYSGTDLRLAWAGEGWRLDAGLAAEQQGEARRGFENFSGSPPVQVLGVTGALRRDEHNRARGRDRYLQGEIDLAPGWIASAGLRQGRLVFDSRDDYLVNGDDSGRLDFAFSTPVAALRWQPAAALALYLSHGRGFETPTLAELAYRGDGRPGFNTSLKPQRSTQWELGAKWRPAGGALAADLALFDSRTLEEIAVQSNAGGRATFANVGRTQRRGAELDLRWQGRAWGAPRWQGQVTLSTLNARTLDGFLACAGTPCSAPTLAAAPGLRIAGTQPRNAFVEVVYAAAPHTQWALEARGQGRVAVDDLNRDFAAGHGLLALRLQQRLHGGETPLSLLLRVDNLADRRVVGSVIVNEGNQRWFEPAAPRRWLLALRWAHGG